MVFNRVFGRIIMRAGVAYERVNTLAGALTGNGQFGGRTAPNGRSKLT